MSYIRILKNPKIEALLDQWRLKYPALDDAEIIKVSLSTVNFEDLMQYIQDLEDIADSQRSLQAGRLKTEDEFLS